MKVFVTGASGLVARYLIDELVNKGYSVYALSSNPEILSERYKNIDNIKCLDKNIVFSESFDEDLKGAILIHSAFTRRNDGIEVASSMDYAISVFRFCKSQSFAAVINISTRSVYKEPDDRTLNTEESVICPQGLIGVGKYSVELFGKEIFSNTSTRFVTLRLASVNELKLDHTMVRPLNVFVANVIKGRNINVIGGMQMMSFIDPRDVAGAILALIDTSVNDWKSTYNVGTGWMCTESLISMAEKVVDIGKRRGYCDSKICVDEKVVNQRAGLNIDRITNDTGWVPLITINDMIESLFDMYETNGVS